MRRKAEAMKYTKSCCSHCVRSSARTHTQGKTIVSVLKMYAIISSKEPGNDNTPTLYELVLDAWLRVRICVYVFLSLLSVHKRVSRHRAVFIPLS